MRPWTKSSHSYYIHLPCEIIELFNKVINMKKMIFTLLIATASIVVTSSASMAFDRHHRHPHSRGAHATREPARDPGRDAGIAILGAVTGVIIGEAIRGSTPPPPPPQYRPIPERHYHPTVTPRHARPHHSRGTSAYPGEPWSPEWFRYCSRTYKSFNSMNGTYVGYDGVRKFCVVPHRR